MEVVHVGAATLGLQSFEQLKSHGVSSLWERHVEVELDLVVIDIYGRRLSFLV